MRKKIKQEVVDNSFHEKKCICIINSYLQNSRHSMKSLLNEYKSSLGIQEPIVIDPHVANIVKAVSALTAAFRLVQLDRCKGHRDAACLRELHADKLHEAILANLKKLSFQTMVLYYFENKNLYFYIM